MVAGERLAARGIVCQNFLGEKTTEPSVIGWMPSAQLYFRDPDGHSLEFITVLDEKPDPHFHGSLSAWQKEKLTKGSTQCMKFQCLCGKILSDSTDEIPYKARMIADEDWNRFTESFERPQGHDWRLVTDIYQCPDCGRLRIEKPTGQVVFFEPESAGVTKTLLASVGKVDNE